MLRTSYMMILNTPGYIANLHKLFDKTLNGNEKDKEDFYFSM